MLPLRKILGRRCRHRNPSQGLFKGRAYHLFLRLPSRARDFKAMLENYKSRLLSYF